MSSSRGGDRGNGVGLGTCRLPKSSELGTRGLERRLRLRSDGAHDPRLVQTFFGQQKTISGRDPTCLAV